MSFVRSYNPVWYFVDNNGKQLDDTYYFFVLQNTFPYLPATVYHDNQGANPWNFPIQFNANGTLPIDIYYDPSQVYRLEVRAGNSQDDLLIDLVENYVPGTGESTNTNDSLVNTDNQISNPQFAFVSFDPSFEATVAGTYEIAPDWFLELVGTGTTTITQEVVAGNQNLPGNVPYVLNIDNSGWTEANLYQRFSGVSGIFSNYAINASVVGISESISSLPITISYIPSNGTPYPIISGVFNTSEYSSVTGGILLPDSDSTDSGETSYVDFVITLPPTGNIKISNVQLISGNISLGTTDSNVIPFLQSSLERQKDALFHRYFNSLLIGDKNTILTGWNFGLNPAQFQWATAPTVSTTPVYVTDQTIVKAQSANSINVQITTTDSNLQIAAINSTTQDQFSVFQYLDPATIRGFWGYKVSSLVRCRVGLLAGITSFGIKMRLIYRTSLPSILGAAEPIVSFDINGDPVFSAGWTAIAPYNDPNYQVGTDLDPLGTGAIGLPFSFNGFQLPDNPGSNATLGIVLYTTGALSAADTTQFFIENITLVPNEFAIDAIPQTADEVLRQCQFYYEHSYNAQQNPGIGLVTTTGQRIAKMTLGGATVSGVYSPPDTLYLASFGFPFKQTKRIAPVMRFYSPASTSAGLIQVGIYRNGSLATASGGSPHTNPYN